MNTSISAPPDVFRSTELRRKERMAKILRRWKEQAQLFTESTTAHGLERVGKDHRPVCYRLIWLAIVLGAMSVAFFNCEERIRTFYSHPFQMIETFEPQAKIPFPAVTVCSAFPLPVLGKDYEQARAIIDRTKESQCYSNSSLREHIAEVTGVSEEVLLFSTADGNLTGLGFSAESFIARCRFNNEFCSFQNFTRHIDPDFFNCYTFNTNELATNNKELTILIYMSTYGRPYNYTDVLEFFTAGAYIQVHEPGIHPSPMKEGRAIVPGTYNLLSLRTSRTLLLEGPVATNCTNRALPSTHYKYNVDVCYKVCLQKMVIEHCGCALAAIHIEKPHTYTGPFCFHDFCNKTLLDDQMLCVKKFYTNLNLDANCQDCKMPACVQWTYEDHHSMLDYFIDFPAHDFVDDFLEPTHPSIADMTDAYGNVTDAPDNFISKNFAKVTVTFADLHIRHKEAQTTMSGFSLFSDLGGAFGFWIGFSIMTFVEVIEWIIRTLISTKPQKEVEETSDTKDTTNNISLNQVKT